MKTKPNDNDVGYKRPPKSKQWKPGQSGIPKHRGPAKTKSAVDVIDRAMMEPIDVTENGKTRKVTKLEAIILQLWLKDVSGNHQARRVRLKYVEFAQRNMRETKTEITFVDNDYTQALSRFGKVK